MNLRPLDWLGWLLAMALGVGFFLPWLKMPYHAKEKETPRAHNSAVVRQLAAESNRPLWQEYLYITPDEWQRATQNATIGLNVTGFEIPRAFLDNAHRLDAGLVSASGLLGEDRNADRAMFVYGFPALAVLAAAFISWVGHKWALLLPLLATAGLYLLTRYQINTTAVNRLALSIDIGLGLWLTLYALLGLCAVLLLRLLLPINTRL